ncbi:MAG: PLD nuclease N-terminal domain-containing protein [Panacagrimonas sp.]
MNINSVGNVGLWGLLVLIADIYAIINIAGSHDEPLKKALWIVLILVLPVLGFIIWFFAGPKSGR